MEIFFIKLVNYGADVKCQEKSSNDNLLHIAARSTLNKYEQTPLMVACNENLHLSTIKSLASKTNNINQRDFTGETALFSACVFNHLRMIKLLLNYGADPYIINKKNVNCFDIVNVDTQKMIRGILNSK